MRSEDHKLSLIATTTLTMINSMSKLQSIMNLSMMLISRMIMVMILSC